MEVKEAKNATKKNHKRDYSEALQASLIGRDGQAARVSHWLSLSLSLSLWHSSSPSSLSVCLS